jgi:hypothetical protein
VTRVSIGKTGAAGLGGTAIPAGIGVLIGHFGAGILGPALAALAAITLGLLTYDRFLLPRRPGRPGRPGSSGPVQAKSFA